MGVFNKNQYNDYNIYNIYSIKKDMDKKRKTLNIVLIAVTIMALVLSIYYIVDTKLRIEQSKRYVEQIIQYNGELEKQKEEERIKAEKEAKIPKLTEQGKENLKNIYRSDEKRAFLTFDDGPSINTEDILNILKENNIKATFFVLGSQVRNFPETTKRLYEEGHYIANHGYTHEYSSIYQSAEQVLTEFNQCNKIVANTIGVSEYNSHLFRFPGGLARRKI